MFFENYLKKWLSEEFRSRFIAILSGYFALAYHIFIFCVFLKVKVPFMVFFNVGSIALFTLSILIITIRKRVKMPFLLSTVEVIFHQIFALYFLGGESSFQYLILIIGLLPFLVTAKDFKISIPIGLFSTSLFIGLTIFDYKIPAHTVISQEWLLIVRGLNIGSSMSIILAMIFIFSYISQLNESELENQVNNQANVLQSQNYKIIEIQNNTIISLSNLVENRDSDTGHHIVRTREYVRLLATKTKEANVYRKTLTNHYIELLVKSAPMHDIGKIVVPDSILKKPGKLTPEEFNEIKRHASEGGKIIRDVLGNSGDEEYINIATEIATAHHEKWDGSGYPYNLRGPNIPLSARIMALADVFDALVSPRCYKEPFTIDAAIGIIQDSIGTHFDPELARIFINNREGLEEIYHKYKD